MAEMTQEKLNKIGEKIKKVSAKGSYGFIDKCLVSNDPKVVLYTIKTLGELRVEKYVDPIAEVVFDAKDPVFRKTAAESLGAMLSDRAVFQLVRRLEVEKDASVSEAILAAIKAIHNKEPEAE